MPEYVLLKNNYVIIEGKFKNNYYISPILRGIFFHILTLKSECILHIAIWSAFLFSSTHKKTVCLGVNVTTDY